jgi:hypothetical protein
MIFGFDLEGIAKGLETSIVQNRSVGAHYCGGRKCFLVLALLPRGY